MASSKKLLFETPKDCCTAWELQRDYGINKQRTLRAIKAKKLNAFMVEAEGFTLIKWYIKRDELFEQYIKDNKK